MELIDPRKIPEQDLFDDDGSSKDPFFANQVDLMDFTNKIEQVCAPLGSSLTLIYLDKFKAEMKENMELQLMNQIQNFESTHDRSINFNENTKLLKRTDAQFNKIIEQLSFAFLE